MAVLLFALTLGAQALLNSSSEETGWWVTCPQCGHRSHLWYDGGFGTPSTPEGYVNIEEVCYWDLGD